MTTITDQELGDLYQRYAPVLLARCRRILANDEEAHDAVQDTFAKVIRNVDSFRNESSPLTWMYKISTNLCLNRLRNKKGRQGHLDRRADEVAPQPLSTPDHQVDHARLHALLDQADEQTKAIVVYTFFDDCTQRETATLTGLSVPTVRKRLRTFLEHARFTMSASFFFLLLLAWRLR